MFTISASSARHYHEKEKDRDLRDLCSKTHDSKLCWTLPKSERSKFHTENKGQVEAAIDLARGKAEEIHLKLDRLREESKKEQLKQRYWSCSKNYNDAIGDLNGAKEMLHKRGYSGIPVLVDDVIEEVESCHNDFDNGEFDPAHVQNRNKEFRVYADLVKVAVDRLSKETRDDGRISHARDDIDLSKCKCH